MRKLVFLLFASIILLASTVFPVSAQDPTPTAVTPVATETPASTPTPLSGGPTYIVSEGDSLTLIAGRFGVKLADLMAANNLTDANALAIGQPLTIPGLEGVEGLLVTERMRFGDSLRTMSRQYQVPQTFITRLNKITSPAELFAGIGVTVPQSEGDVQVLVGPTSLRPGESLLELAVRQQTSQWELSTLNYLSGNWDGIPGDTYFTRFGTEDEITTGLPTAFKAVDITLPMKQGGTTVITISTDPGVTLGGMLVDKPLHFFQNGDAQVALQGVHALLETGPYPLRLEATLPDGSQQVFEQNVLVTSGYYAQDPVLIVDPSFVDPAVTDPENVQLFQIAEPANPEKAWSGIFGSPAYDPYCYNSRYGNRRSYNNSAFTYFHTGIDFCGGEGLPIYAPADGTVVFAGPLTVRGNATIIDHGWGVYSGFWHQVEIQVKVGDKVTKGQQIGVVGGTGRVTGAHLHWELIVNGVQVNPVDWLENVYP